MLKKLVFVRGLPGSGKTTHSIKLCDEFNELGVSSIHIEVDALKASNETSSYELILEAIRLKAHSFEIIIIDGVFPKMQVILSIYSKIKTLSRSLRLVVDSPDTEWCDNPYKCWMKTVERSTDQKLVPLHAVMDLWNRWESVSLSRHSPGNTERN